MKNVAAELYWNFDSLSAKKKELVTLTHQKSLKLARQQGGCIEVINSYKEIKSTTISGCWKNLLPDAAINQNVTVEILREEVEEITSLSQQFVEGAVQELNTTDIEELLLSHNEELTNEELIGMLEKNGEDEVDNDDDILPPKRLKMDALDRVFSLSQEIEAILVENDPVMERSLRFKRQIEEAISPYRELTSTV
ncbi:hypothetical protein QE152_g35941 [Popillia japonica]|uniref:Uncharacterized protein n=1 Tax=Popillia japonica TaxID=7064 RepID=A0AAW1IEH3_POPJA